MRLREAIAAAAARLAQTSGTSRLDAELLMAHALGVERDTMLLRHLDDPAPVAFDGLVERRAAHEPIAYITGRRAFWTIELAVGPGVLIPRPDSETLIEAAVAHFGEQGPATILDLGTGPGSLLLAALSQWPDACGLGVDRSERARGYFETNVAALGLEDRARFRLGDWTDGLEDQWDLILCNPPYVESGDDLPPDVALWEPDGALFAGADGLDDYRRLAPHLGRLLAPGGIACVEIGAGQEEKVLSLFKKSSVSIESRSDLKGIARCLIIGLDPE
jgi:release factor glutamine methyltransferase